MKKTILSSCLVAGLIFMTNCSYKYPRALSIAATTPEAKVAEVKKKYSDAQIQEGKLLWKAACTKCHSLIAPEGHSVESWERILPRMLKRSNVTAEQSGKIRAYVLSNAERMTRDEPQPKVNKKKGLYYK